MYKGRVGPSIFLGILAIANYFFHWKPNYEKSSPEEIIFNFVLEFYWHFKLKKLKKKTGFIGLHTYPEDTKTGWRKLKSDYKTIKSMDKLQKYI